MRRCCPKRRCTWSLWKITRGTMMEFVTCSEPPSSSLRPPLSPLRLTPARWPQQRHRNLLLCLKLVGKMWMLTLFIFKWICWFWSVVIETRDNIEENISTRIGLILRIHFSNQLCLGWNSWNAFNDADLITYVSTLLLVCCKENKSYTFFRPSRSFRNPSHEISLVSVHHLF